MLFSVVFFGSNSLEMCFFCSFFENILLLFCFCSGPTSVRGLHRAFHTKNWGTFAPVNFATQSKTEKVSFQMEEDEDDDAQLERFQLRRTWESRFVVVQETFTHFRSHEQSGTMESCTCCCHSKRSSGLNGLN